MRRRTVGGIALVAALCVVPHASAAPLAAVTAAVAMQRADRIQSPDDPWYTIVLPDVVPGPARFISCCTDPTRADMHLVLWEATAGGEHGMLFLVVDSSPQAHASEYGEELVTVRVGPNGAAWLFTSVGFSKVVREDLARRVVRDSSGRYVLRDPRVRFLAEGTAGRGDLRFQVFWLGTEAVVLSVGAYRGQLHALAHGDAPSRVTVAGERGYLSELGAVWPVAGRWASVEIPYELRDRVGEILAAIHPARSDLARPAPLLHPEISGQFRGVATMLETDDGGAEIAAVLSDVLYPTSFHIPVVGVDWDAVSGPRGPGILPRWGTWELTGTWDGNVLTLTEPPASPLYEPSRHLNDESYYYCYDDVAFVATRDELKSATSGLRAGIRTTAWARPDGSCGLLVQAVFDSPELRAALAPFAVDILRLTFDFTPIV